MTRARGVLGGNVDDEPFIGWAAAPVIDRRFLLGLTPLLAAGLGGGAWALARAAGDPGAGEWRTGEIHRVSGLLAATPYPMLYVADPASPYGVRTVLIVADGKCTSGLKLAAQQGRSITASGHLIRRGGREMLEVPLALDRWLEETPATRITVPPLQRLGTVRLAGQIVDSKCFFGVMRPARGKSHKACASFCIRGGIPPSFWVQRADGREAVLLMTDASGQPHGEAILPLVADPVEATGELVRVADIVQFRADASAFRRIGPAA